ARETATVMPRSLKLPVGFAPSSLRRTRAPTRSEIVGASTSGVEPSLSVTTGSPSSSGNRPRDRSITAPGMGQRRRHSHEIYLDHADGARRGADEVERADLLEGGEEPRLRALVHHHHEAGLVTEPSLDDASDRNLVAAQHVGDLREDPGAVRHLEVQIEGRDD